MYWVATDIPNKKPLQTAFKSKAAALIVFSLWWTKAAVEGAFLSGVAVATIIKSISSLFNPASSMALCPAIAAKSLVAWLLSAIRLSKIPTFS